MPAESRDQEHQFENPEATKLENETTSKASRAEANGPRGRRTRPEIHQR